VLQTHEVVVIPEGKVVLGSLRPVSPALLTSHQPVLNRRDASRSRCHFYLVLDPTRTRVILRCAEQVLGRGRQPLLLLLIAAIVRLVHLAEPPRLEVGSHLFLV